MEIERTKNLKEKNITQTFFVSLLTFLVLFLILATLLWSFRGKVFEYFATQYFEQAKEEIQNQGSLDESSASVLSQERFVIESVKKANPAVVSIIVLKEVPTYQFGSGSSLWRGSLFDLFFAPEGSENELEERKIGGGSGFFVTNDGLIVTNRHVVDDSEATYKVFTNDGVEHDAEVIALDPVLDVGLVKITGNKFPSLNLGDSDALQVGQGVIAIGNALGEFRNTVSVGVVSGLARSVTAGDYFGNFEFLDGVIQTDAAINSGNSGGPLLDLSGRVIGVNVAVAQGSENIGFALPINSIKGAIESVKETGKIIRPFLGVRYVPITPGIQERNSLEVNYGVLIRASSNPNELGVLPGSPADKAGLRENDIILEVDGVKVDLNRNFASIIRQKAVGQEITLKVLSRGEEKILKATLEAAPDNM